VRKSRVEFQRVSDTNVQLTNTDHTWFVIFCFSGKVAAGTTEIIEVFPLAELLVQDNCVVDDEAPRAGDGRRLQFAELSQTP
jgi:hypothetical protein